MASKNSADQSPKATDKARGLALRLRELLSRNKRITVVVVAVIVLLVVVVASSGGMGAGTSASSPGIWELPAPTASDETGDMVLQLSNEQRAQATSITYAIIRKADEGTGYHAALLDIPVEADKDGRIVIPHDPQLPTVVTNGGSDRILMGARCELDESGLLHYTTDELRLAATADLSNGYPGGYDVVSVNATFDANGTAKEVSLTRKDPPYPLGKTVTSDELSLYNATFYAWKSSLSKVRAEDGTLAPVEAWPGGGSITLLVAFCDEGLDFELVPASRVAAEQGHEFYVQVCITDAQGNVHASDISDALGPYEQAKNRTIQVQTPKGSMTFVLADDHATFAEYSGEDTTLEIPAQVENLPVTIIDDAALKNDEYVREIVLPDGITSIGGSAFSGSQLQSFAVPASLEHLGPGAFSNTRRLAQFVQKGKGKLTSVQDGVLFSADGSTLLSYPSAKGATYEVPDGVTTIGHGAFAGAEVTHVDLPSSLTRIESYAFAGCSELDVVELPAGLEYIGSGAWSLDGFMKEDYAAQNTIITLGPKVRYVGRDAFEGLALDAIQVDKKNLAYRGDGGFLLSKDGALLMAPATLRGTVVVPEGTTSLEAGSLTRILVGIEDNYVDYAEVYLPKSLTSIADNALPQTYKSGEFSDGDEVYSVRLHVPEDSWAQTFAQKNDIPYDNYCDTGNGTSKVATVEVPKATLSFMVYADHAVLTSIEANNAGHVEVPAKVDGVPVTTVAESDGYVSYGNVITVVLPSSVREVTEGSLLHNISSLRRIHMTKANKWLCEKDGMLYSADGTTLVACPASYDDVVKVPESTREIGDSAFTNCTATTVKLPEGLERIGASAFQSADGITSIELPSSLKSIGAQAFSYSSLKEVRLNEGLQTIGRQAFYDLEGYEGLSIPNSVTTVGAHAFDADGEYEQKLLPIGSDSLSIGESLCDIYEAPFFWLDFTSFEVADGNTQVRAEGPLLLSTDGRTLYSCAGGTTGELHIPEGVEELGAYALTGIPNVTDLYLPNSLLRMDENAFGLYGTPSESLTIHVPEGSGAATLLDDAGFPYETY